MERFGILADVAVLTRTWSPAQTGSAGDSQVFASPLLIGVPAALKHYIRVQRACTRRSVFVMAKRRVALAGGVAVSAPSARHTRAGLTPSLNG